MIRVAVVAPARSLPQEAADTLLHLARSPQFTDIEISIHPQCFASMGHFAGPDADRASALIEVATDPSVDAVWFARGGYGACRIVDDVLGKLTQDAHNKIWLGYSDAGYLLAAFDRAKIGRSVHGPMVADSLRENGVEAIERVLHFFSGATSGREPSLDGDHSAVALNASILSSVVATQHMPSLKNRLLMIEEIDEHLYAFDRALFTAFNSGKLDSAAGVLLGRVSVIPENDIPFGETAEEIVQRWCQRRDIPYLGRADIGHDAQNKIVPFRGDQS